jgi:ABC transporter DrrB family efflux protein
MTAITTRHRAPRPGVVGDALILAWRSYKHYRRVPSLLVFSLTTPLIFVLLFRYILGGAIEVTGVTYVDFLIPGVLVQTLAFGATETGVSVAEDLARGITDRFRSLPITRSAVLAGRALADTARNFLVAIIVLVVGLLIGFRPDDDPGRLLAGLAIAMAFSFAFSWVAASIGVAVRSVVSGHDARFVWVIPLTFASSALVPVDTMPAALRWFADINPVTSVVDATRALMLGDAAGGPTLRALLWIVGLLLVFVPLAVRGYQRR